MEVKCPTCKRLGEWFEGSYGPFCSKRCRLVDLGKWFGEEHAISDPLRPEHLESFAELPPGDHLDRPGSETSANDASYPQRNRT